jgi:nucleotidyltransferase substrate binding protein (TIGR01987 family)
VWVCFAAELLENADQWMEMIGDRNRTSHTFNERTADEITGRILDSYIQCLERFEQTMTEKEREES